MALSLDYLSFFRSPISERIFSVCPKTLKIIKLSISTAFITFLRISPSADPTLSLNLPLKVGEVKPQFSLGFVLLEFNTQRSKLRFLKHVDNIIPRLCTPTPTLAI